MSTEGNKAVVRKFLENEDTPELYAEVFAPHFVGYGPLAVAPEPVDVQGRLRATAAIINAFPEMELKIEDLIAERDKVVARLSISGEHLGEFRGIPPTGKQVSFAATLVFRLAGGQIVEEWANLDLLGVLIQLGAVPTPGPTSGR